LKSRVKRGLKATANSFEGSVAQEAGHLRGKFLPNKFREFTKYNYKFWVHFMWTRFRLGIHLPSLGVNL